MKKLSSLFALCFVLCAFSACTMPWAAKTTPEAEVVTTENGTPAPEGEVPTPTDIPKDITPSDTPKGIAEGGIYLPYTPTAVAQAKGNVVLFFYANWCPTCVATEKDIKANLTSIPKDLTILRVNFDEATDLKKLYGVVDRHTFVQVDNSGKKIKLWRGGNTLQDVISQINGTETKDAPTDNKATETKTTETEKTGTAVDPF